jgi:hypothetical protein
MQDRKTYEMTSFWIPNEPSETQCSPVILHDVVDGNAEGGKCDLHGRFILKIISPDASRLPAQKHTLWGGIYVQASNERQTVHLNQLLLNCVPTAHLRVNVASPCGPIAAGPSNARSHAHLRHIYDHKGEIGVASPLNVSGSHVDGAIESGFENGRRQGCNGHAIAGIHGPWDHHRDLLCRRSGVVWVKANDYRDAGGEESGSAVGYRRGVCRCEHDAAPCVRPCPVSL